MTSTRAIDRRVVVSQPRSQEQNRKEIRRLSPFPENLCVQSALYSNFYTKPKTNPRNFVNLKRVKNQLLPTYNIYTHVTKSSWHERASGSGLLMNFTDLAAKEQCCPDAIRKAIFSSLESPMLTTVFRAHRDRSRKWSCIIYAKAADCKDGFGGSRVEGDRMIRQGGQHTAKVTET